MRNEIIFLFLITILTGCKRQNELEITINDILPYEAIMSDSSTVYYNKFFLTLDVNFKNKTNNKIDLDSNFIIFFMFPRNNYNLPEKETCYILSSNGGINKNENQSHLYIIWEEAIKVKKSLSKFNQSLETQKQLENIKSKMKIVLINKRTMEIDTISYNKPSHNR